MRVRVAREPKGGARAMGENGDDQWSPQNHLTSYTSSREAPDIQVELESFAVIAKRLRRSSSVGIGLFTNYRALSSNTLAECETRHRVGVSGSDEPVGFPSSSRTTMPPSTSLGKEPLL